MVGDFEASGLPRRGFCADRELPVAALDKYRRQHRSGLGVGE
jgi:hypothetical protein